MRAILERAFVFVEERVVAFEPREGYRGSTAEYLNRLLLVSWPLALICIGEAFLRMFIGDQGASRWLGLFATVGAIITALPLMSRCNKSIVHVMMAVVLFAAFLACLRHFHQLS